MTAAEKLISIVLKAEGDDLERAQLAFCRMSRSEMKQPYGQSCQTCQQVLDGYVIERAEWQAAFDLAKSL